jgi:hypothetical protein
MTEFPATDVALEGFRLTREQPRAVAVWAAVRVGFTLAAVFVMNVVSGPQLTAFMVAVASGRSVDELGRTAEPLLPTLMGLVPFDLAVQAILMTAFFRAVFQPLTGGAFYLRFGLDELRMFGVNVLGLAAVMIGALVVSVVGGGVSLLAGAAGAAGPVIAAAYFAVVVAAAGYLSVRLSLTPALTQLEGRFALRHGWKLTAGRHWVLLGAYVMAGMLGVLIYILGAVIGSVFQLLDPAHTVSFTSLAAILSTAWMAMVGVLISVVLQAPGAAAVQAMLSVRRAV